MGRARDIAEAEQQADDEAWQCATCSAPAQEDGKYCCLCEMYWQDVDQGRLSDNGTARRTRNTRPAS